MQRVVLYLKFKYLNFGNFKFRIPPKFGIQKFKIPKFVFPKFGQEFPHLYQNPKIKNFKFCILKSEL